MSYVAVMGMYLDRYIFSEGNADPEAFEPSHIFLLGWYGFAGSPAWPASACGVLLEKGL